MTNMRVKVTYVWRAYNRVGNIPGLTHRTVNHSLFFVDPVTGVHTQNIESYWNHCKEKLKRSGSPGYAGWVSRRIHVEGTRGTQHIRHNFAGNRLAVPPVNQCFNSACQNQIGSFKNHQPLQKLKRYSENIVVFVQILLIQT